MVNSRALWWWGYTWYGSSGGLDLGEVCVEDTERVEVGALVSALLLRSDDESHLQMDVKGGTGSEVGCGCTVGGLGKGGGPSLKRRLLRDLLLLPDDVRDDIVQGVGAADAEVVRTPDHEGLHHTRSTLGEQKFERGERDDDAIQGGAEPPGPPNPNPRTLRSSVGSKFKVSFEYTVSTCSHARRVGRRP